MENYTCFIIVTVLWVFSVCLHEFGHALAAYRGGDYTVQEKGYLTMNPIHYTHPIYSLLLPVVFVMLGGIGLPGGAVYINHHLLRSRGWETAVALAGPAMNVLLIVLIGIAFKSGLVPADPTKLATISLAFVMQLQVSALLLNLIPVPPLDGFQAIAPWLPAEWRERMHGMANIGLFIVFVALSFIPAFGNAFWSIVRGVSELMGVNPYWGAIGYRAFRFWD